MNPYRSALYLGLVACFAAGSAFAAPAARLVTRVEPVEGKALGTSKVQVSVTNNGKEAVMVLYYQTALRGVEDDLFDVSLNGMPVRYLGRDFKRAAPEFDDYIELKAGETRTATVDLSEVYEMRSAGRYSVSFRGDFDLSYGERPEDHSKLLAATSLKAASAASFVWVDGAHLYNDPDMSHMLLAKAGSTSFVGCTSTRQSQLNTAKTSANSYAANSNTYLAGSTHGARFSTWFGSYTSAHWATIKSHFTAIADVYNNKPVTFDCSTCTMSAYAYVYPNQPYKIYLCSAFWSAPNTGTDSRAGTIIHETSHFDVVANTDDNAYGQTAAKKLATTNVTKALANADSHEYFAENTPFQN